MLSKEEKNVALGFEVVRLSDEGFSQRRIAEKPQLPKSTVQHILKNCRIRNTVMRIKGSGRKKLLDDEDKAILFESVDKNPMISAKKLSMEIAKRTEKKVTPRTIQYELK
jgi:transposase